MSIDEERSKNPTDGSASERTRESDYAQYLVVAVLAIVGAFLVYSAVTLPAGFAKVDPLGPKFFPMVIGIAACAVVAFALTRLTIKPTPLQVAAAAE